MDVFWAAPPVSRTLAAAVLIVSALGHTGLIPLMPLVFIRPKVFKLIPEIWRVATAFLITGPQLSIILDPFFLYRYGSDLETGSPRFTQPGDFFTYLVFVGLVIVGLSGMLLQRFVFLQPLILALAYTFSQDNPNRMVSFFIVNFQAKYLPFAMLFLTFIMAGQGEALNQCCGLLAAHLYDFLNRIWPAFGGGSNEPWIKSPEFVRRAFGADNPAPRHRDYGTAFPGRPGAQQAGGAGQAAATGSQGGTWSSGNAWNARGPGRRLG